MSHDTINHWVARAKTGEENVRAARSEVKVVRATPANEGSAILELAERLRPWLNKMFANVRDEEGIVYAPARMRGMALNLAQSLIHSKKSGS